MNKATLISKHQTLLLELLAFLQPLSEQELDTSMPGKWSIREQVEHLVLCIRPFDMVFAMPKFAIKAVYSRDKNISFSYEQIVQQYEEKLKAGAVASTAYVPSVKYSKDALIKRCKEAHDKYIAGMLKYSEEDLDSLVVPHPLIGKLSMREMLYFSLYHIAFHFMRIKEIYGAQ